MRKDINPKHFMAILPGLMRTRTFSDEWGQWQAAAESDFPMIIILTWDVMFEGTAIEPSVETGMLLAQIARKYATRYKGIPENDGNLMLLIWICKIRKSTADSVFFTETRTACEYMVLGNYAEAEKIVLSVMEKLQISTDAGAVFETQ